MVLVFRYELGCIIGRDRREKPFSVEERLRITGDVFRTYNLLLQNADHLPPGKSVRLIIWYFYCIIEGTSVDEYGTIGSRFNLQRHLKSDCKTRCSSLYLMTKSDDSLAQQNSYLLKANVMNRHPGSATLIVHSQSLSCSLYDPERSWVRER